MDPATIDTTPNHTAFAGVVLGMVASRGRVLLAGIVPAVPKRH